MIKVDFLRQSNDGRLTLVLHESGTIVRSLWAMMDSNDLNQAKDALRHREGISVSGKRIKKKPDSIKSWQIGDAGNDLVIGLPEWAEAHGISGVIWTALQPKFHFPGDSEPKNEPPTAQDALTYLQSLQGTRRDYAEQYIRRTPRQVDTAYRRSFEATLGWTSRV